MAKKEIKTPEQEEAKATFDELMKGFDIADDLNNDGNNVDADKLRGILRNVERFIAKQM